MRLNYSLSFALQRPVRPLATGEYYVRLHCSAAGHRLKLSAGLAVPPAGWDKETGRLRRGFRTADGRSASSVNDELSRIAVAADDALRLLAARPEPPSREELRAALLSAMGRAPVAERPDDLAFAEAADRLCLSRGALNGWSLATASKVRTLAGLVAACSPRLRLSGVTPAWLQDFLVFMVVNKHYHNETIRTELKLLRWLMDWAAEAGHVPPEAAEAVRAFRPRLRTVARREVVYLDREEVRAIEALPLSPGETRLARARDFFLFLCFTGLRYGDAAALRWEDLGPDALRSVNRKTGATVVVELNARSAAIVRRYRGQPRPLPKISNQKLNDYIKELARRAGITAPVSRTWYIGGQRYDEVREKCDLLGTHTGRRTFICLALQLGIAPATIMQWTGHSAYRAMQPYVGVSARRRADAMRLFDDLPGDLPAGQKDQSE